MVKLGHFGGQNDVICQNFSYVFQPNKCMHTVLIWDKYIHAETIGATSMVVLILIICCNTNTCLTNLSGTTDQTTTVRFIIFIMQHKHSGTFLGNLYAPQEKDLSFLLHAVSYINFIAVSIFLLWLCFYSHHIIVPQICLVLFC